LLAHRLGHGRADLGVEVRRVIGLARIAREQQRRQLLAARQAADMGGLDMGHAASPLDCKLTRNFTVVKIS
jgi:hypothetical protein